MYPAPFEYHVPSTVAEAVALLGQWQDDAKLIAGSQNLVTIGGSLAHADPAADWPAVTVALDASVTVAGPRGERTVPVEQLISGPLTTVLEPGEILVQVRIPLPGARSGSA